MESASGAGDDEEAVDETDRTDASCNARETKPKATKRKSSAAQQSAATSGEANPMIKALQAEHRHMANVKTVQQSLHILSMKNLPYFGEEGNIVDML